MISSMVITLVTLAGASRSWHSFSYSTVPVATSISSALLAFKSRFTARALTGSSDTVSVAASSRPSTRFIVHPSILVDSMRPTPKA